MQIIYTITAFVIALGILVIVHEFGHYWVAKKLGVKVLRFSVGFGRTIWSRRFGKDNTELVVAALPLGGYVKMLDENEGEVAEDEKHRAFNRQSIPKRMAIVIAGPLFNFLFAIVAFWVIFLAGVEGLKPVVGKVIQGSIAEQSGIRSGDEITHIDGKKVFSWSEHRLYLLNKALSGDVVTFELVDKQGAYRKAQVDLGKINIRDVSANVLSRGIGIYPQLPDLTSEIGTVLEGPARNAGLKSGDKILRVNGKLVRDWNELVKEVSTRPGEKLSLRIDRDGEQFIIKLLTDSVEVGGNKIGRIQIGPKAPEIPEHMMVKRAYGPVQALIAAGNETMVMSVLTLRMLYKMLMLEVSAKNISGPITIAQYAGYSAQAGLDRFLMFLAVVSISLGVLNLLPIPILDGGHLLYYGIEAIKGSPVSEETMAWGQRVGIAILLMLMALAFYNDITRLL